MAAAGFALEHFYYGQFVRENKPEGDLRLLASSAGIKDEQVAEIVQAAIVPPLVSSPGGSWALVRGKTVPFIFVQSQLTSAGAAMLHFIVMPVDVLRALGGNVKAMMTLLEREMPAYDRMGDRLPLLMLAQAQPPSDEMQSEAMLALMSCTQDKLDVIELLLSAIVQGVQLYVRNAPPEVMKRASFVEGLLALLPPPARFGVTFAMHTLQTTRIDAQIRYSASADSPEAATIFDWASGLVSGSVVSDDYSRFIVSQLRLDTSLVLEQTNALTAVASWRIKRGDGLAEALGYASHRLKIDNSLLNNLPVPAEEVSRVLQEDPTLSDTLRAAYARHVLAFALALGDMQYAEPIAFMLRQQPEVERAALQLMRDALQSGKTQIIYEVILRWMSNPLGPSGMEWTALVQGAAVGYLQALVKEGDTEAVRHFLEELHRVDPQIELNRVLPRMIQAAVPLMERDKALSSTVFLLAAHYLAADALRDIITDRTLLAQLPESVSKLASYLSGEEAGPPPAGLMPRVSSSFDAEWEPLVLIRLTEVALLAQRNDLLDTSALAGLARAAQTQFANEYDALFRWVARSLSTDEFLPTLDDPGPRYLLQMLLARRAYPELAVELLRHSRVLYSADKQGDYAVMVRRLFAETPLNDEEIADALRILNAGGVKPLPLAMAHLGALKRNGWPTSLQQIAVTVTDILFNNRVAIVEAIPPASLVELLDFHVKRRDANNSIRIAGLLPLLAAHKGEGGAALMAQMYGALDWDKQPRVAALEILRRYIRLTDEAFARQAMMRLGELDERVKLALEATYAFREMMGGEDMSGYALLIHLSMKFLQDTTLVYVDKKQAPSLKSLFSDLDSLVGGLTDDDRLALSATMLNLGRAIATLGRQQRQMRPRDLDAHIVEMLDGKGTPQSALDVLRVMAGYFSRGRRLKIKLERPTNAHPLGDRAAPSLLWESQAVTRVLRNLLKAFPPEERIHLGADVIRAELESLCGDLSLLDRRNLVRDLAIDLQNVPELIMYITDSSDAKVLEENNGQGRKLDGNKQKPVNTLEFYRFVHGYFKMRTKEK